MSFFAVQRQFQDHRFFAQIESPYVVINYYLSFISHHYRDRWELQSKPSTPPTLHLNVE